MKLFVKYHRPLRPYNYTTDKCSNRSEDQREQKPQYVLYDLQMFMNFIVFQINGKKIV